MKESASIDQNLFLDRARSIQITDPETQEVWNALLLAIEQGHCTPELMLEMLATLNGKSGRTGYNELSLDDDNEEGGDGSRAVLYYLGYSSEKLSCAKEKLLEAFSILYKTSRTQ